MAINSKRQYFSTFHNEFASRAWDGTVYQNTTNKIMMLILVATTAANTTIYLYTDSANPPTQQMGLIHSAVGGVTVGGTITALIQPNHFYKVTASGVHVPITWFEIY